MTLRRSKRKKRPKIFRIKLYSGFLSLGTDLDFPGFPVEKGVATSTYSIRWRNLEDRLFYTLLGSRRTVYLSDPTEAIPLPQSQVVGNRVQQKYEGTNNRF